MTTETATPPAVPLDWTADAALIDGTAISIRPLIPADQPALRLFYEQLSPESIRLRYFSPRHELTDTEVARLTGSDGSTHVHLGAFQASQLVGVGDFILVTPTEAEVAFVVSDQLQGHGVASLLLEYLAELARALGVRRFLAETMSDNLKMLDVFRHAGFIEKVGSPEAGIVGIRLDISDLRGARAAIGERDRLASVAAVRSVLEPRSVAVIGAGRTPGGIGHQILRNLIQGPFNGRVYPVNRGADHVSGVPAYGSVTDIPGGVNLAVIAVPAGAVLDAVRECGAAGVSSPGGDHRRLRRDRRRGGRARAALARYGPRRGHPDDRAQLHGGHQHRPRRAAQRHLRADARPRRRLQLRQPVRSARRRHPQRGP